MERWSESLMARFRMYPTGLGLRYGERAPHDILRVCTLHMETKESRETHSFAAASLKMRHVLAEPDPL